MQPDKLIQFLTGTNLVKRIDASEIVQRFQPFNMAKNDMFLSEGKLCDTYLFLEQGCMRAFAHDVDGQDITTQFYQPLQLVFEVSSFFNRTRSKENIQALSDCAGWSLTYDELNRLFHELPAFREFGRHVLVKSLTGLKSRMLSMITETAEERYDKLLHENPDIFQFAALKHIASYLGITDSSLSRIRKDYSRKS
jgi:CRP-like cAMP-binding protein